MTALVHDPSIVAEKLAPVPAAREEATTDAWVRHYAAQSFAAFAEFTRAIPATLGRAAGDRPDVSVLIGLAVASMSAAYAIAHPGSWLPRGLWDLTPEAGALNGEWEEWLVDTLDRYGINPADINPAYNSADFNSPTQAETAAQR